MSKKNGESLFDKIKSEILDIDPVSFSETKLTLDGEPFRLTGNGYKPFADIYRYVGIKALERDSKPIVIVKGRQVGATTMAANLEMYFMGCGLFGKGNRPPIRIIHAFPQLDLAFAYTKTKLNPVIANSITVDSDKRTGRTKSYMQNLLDKESSSNDSLSLKQFVGGNHIWIESTGIDGDRLRGRSADIEFFDECFPYEQTVQTELGKISIGKLHDYFKQNKKLPKVLTFNEKTKEFEYKSIKNAWKRKDSNLFELICENRKIKCTSNHRFLTTKGWKKVEDMLVGDAILTSNPSSCQISYSLNEDQHQIILGSFLGDGHLAYIGKNKYRLSVIHGIKQKEYCEWKAKIFNAKTKDIIENGYSKTEAINLITKTFYIENEFPKIKRSCPQWILDNLDLRGLAIWCMDDGSKNNKNSFTLSTCSFDEDSQIRIVKKLKSFGIESNYKSYKKGYYSIYINTEGFKKLSELISPYIHDNISYKFLNQNTKKYNWNNEFNNYGISLVKSIKDLKISKPVYDIEVEDNHNFMVCASKNSVGSAGLIAHNCQDIPPQAIGNSTKILAQAKYGALGSGVQVYFGTPKQAGSAFWEMWQKSSQQYFNLLCEKCGQHFPLYTPGSNEWERIWLYGYTVKCRHCNFEQDKRKAAENGKWVASKSPDDCDFVGFHISQLFMPNFTKEKIESEKPGNSPVNTERAYQNEVLGEFYKGEASPITAEEITEKCADRERKFRRGISPSDQITSFLGLDWGAKADLEELANPNKKAQGQSFSTAVVLVPETNNILSIQFATKLKRNDFEEKKGVVEQLMRQYSITLAVGDIGYAGDLTQVLQQQYGDRFLASQASNKVNDHIKCNMDVFPKFISFERDFYIAEMFEKMKRGEIRFPYGSYEQIGWLIQHCTSMEIKPIQSTYGDITVRYIKGSSPNDGFMALLNAYIAYRFFITSGFKIKDPNMINSIASNKQNPMVISGYIPRM